MYYVFRNKSHIWSRSLVLDWSVLTNDLSRREGRKMRRFTAGCSASIFREIKNWARPRRGGTVFQNINSVMRGGRRTRYCTDVSTSCFSLSSCAQSHCSQFLLFSTSLLFSGITIFAPLLFRFIHFRPPTHFLGYPLLIYSVSLKGDYHI